MLHSGEMFCNMKEFSSGQLPTKKQVIERTLYEDSYLQKNDSAIVAKRIGAFVDMKQCLSCLWSNCNKPNF